MFKVIWECLTWAGRTYLLVVIGGALLGTLLFVFVTVPLGLGLYMPGLLRLLLFALVITLVVKAVKGTLQPTITQIVGTIKKAGPFLISVPGWWWRGCPLRFS